MSSLVCSGIYTGSCSFIYAALWVVVADTVYQGAVHSTYQAEECLIIPPMKRKSPGRIHGKRLCALNVHGPWGIDR
jgi:hypothetical protein